MRESLLPVVLQLLVVTTSAQSASGPGGPGRDGGIETTGGGGGSSLDPVGVGDVLRDRKISAVLGGFAGLLNEEDHFGSALAALGDLDGNGVVDLAVGAPGDDEGGLDRGAVWILFLHANGTVEREHKIDSASPALAGLLENQGMFGTAVAPLGDFDGDGVGDLVVGAPRPVGSHPGAVYLLILRTDGSVREAVEIVDTFVPDPDRKRFGSAVDALGDLDGDGVTDIVVGAPRALPKGIAVVLFLNTDGTVRDSVNHDPVYPTDYFLEFGGSVARLGDMDGDGVVDMAVATPTWRTNHTLDDDGGGFYVYFLRPDGTRKSHRFVSYFCVEPIVYSAQLGSALALLSDLDGDGVRDLAVGSWTYGASGCAAGESPLTCKAGAVRIFFDLHQLPIVCEHDTLETPHSLIAHGTSGFQGVLQKGDRFGGALASLGDLNGDGFHDLAVGVPYDDDGGVDDTDRGALWILSLDGFQTIDFENQNGSILPIANGREISGSLPQGGLAEIEGLSAAGLGAAVFDSTPDGPNEASSDPDLLVDRGNVLILQERPGQSVPGVFDTPDDDRRGGALSIDFGGEVAEPRSIDLVDLCPSVGQDAIVTLFDQEGRERVYTVPPGWTEDVVMDGPPGFRTLDLTTLSEQPGYLSTALAFEDGGFTPTHVVGLEVLLGGSGAVDNLVYRRRAPRPPVGLVVDDMRGEVLVFDPGPNEVLETIPLGTLGCGDCVVTRDGELGFVASLDWSVWVIDLASSPPALATGTNPIPVSNRAQDLALTADQRFLVVCGGAVEEPLSVVDVATRTETSVGPSMGCTALEMHGNDSVLVATEGSIRRLILDETGGLTDSGAELIVGDGLADGPVDVDFAARGAMGLTIRRDPVEILSFTIPGLTLVEKHPWPTGTADETGVSIAIHPNGHPFYARSSSELVRWTLDPRTGSIGEPEVLAPPPHRRAADCPGVDQMAFHPNGSKLFVTRVPKGILSFEGTSGAFLGIFGGQGALATRGVFVGGPRGSLPQPIARAPRRR